MYKIYTDGSCLGNPGPGGWAYAVIGNDVKYSDFGFVDNTTNQKMELLAIIKAIISIKEVSDLIVYTDSMYVVNGMRRWVVGWINNNWKLSSGKPVKNKNLWRNLYLLTKEHKSVEFVWVKGHSGDNYNEAVDSMARFAVKNRVSGKDSSIKRLV